MASVVWSAHVLMIPYPAQPHIFPMLDLAHKLTECRGIRVTFVSFQILIDRLQQEFTRSGSKSNDAIQFVGVPEDRPGFNPPSELPEDPEVLRVSLQLCHNLEPLLLGILQDRESSGLQGPTCLLADTIHWWTIDVAARLSIPRYGLDVRSASFVLLMLHSGEKGFTYEDESSVINAPGLPPLTHRQLPLSSRKSPAFTKEFRKRWPKAIRECDALLVNTCMAMEAQVIDSVRGLVSFEGQPVLKLSYSMGWEIQISGDYHLSLHGRQPRDAFRREGKPWLPTRDVVNNPRAFGWGSNLFITNDPLMPGKIFLPVGPLALSPASFSKNVSMEGLRLTNNAEVMDWLDQQPSLSVIYVGFGTTGMLRLAKRHVFELARGLEDSEQRFVWALRAPNDAKDDEDFLPPGFEERVRGRGLLLRGWAPQLEILEHPSTGAFLSSCGWNSATESVSRGVPIVGWPSFADQGLTCRYMTFALKVAIELPQQPDHFVEAEEVKSAIILVLQSGEGRAMRERTAKYKVSIAAAIVPGGTSAQAIEEFADLLKHPPVSS